MLCKFYPFVDRFTLLLRDFPLLLLKAQNLFHKKTLLADSDIVISFYHC